MEQPLTHIQPPGRFSTGFREIWQYRELFYFFTWRDIKVKYKQTLLGITWVLLQPLGLMLLFTFLFSNTFKPETGDIPYPVFVLSGLIIWNLFNSAVTHAGESMLQHANIIKKIYFPRLIIPGSSILVSIVDFLMAFVVFVLICFFYGQHFTFTSILFFLGGLSLIILTALGAGSFLAALNVKYRDFRYTIPFALQILFFASQVIYPLQQVQQPILKILLALNPVNTAISLFRAGLGQPINWGLTYYGLGSMLLILIAGITYFRKTESYFADIA
jgi:lipopolysaccharide transport system permease protein